MTSGLKVFFASFLLSLPFWWGVNLMQKSLEDFLFWGRMSVNPDLLMAQVIQENNLAELKPIRDLKVQDLEIGAESALSVFVDNGGSERILFEKNSEKALPTASLTKLMTANIVLKYYDISQAEIAQLLYPLLIASDNDVASLLATTILNEEAFVDLMNLEAKKLGLTNTYFANPTGLDPKKEADRINYSTAKDLIRFARYLVEEKNLIWEISTIAEFEEKVNTNELLQEFPEIIGGKTGETLLAGKCLILVVQAPKNKGYIINVILNSKNHFEEMKKLMDWAEYAYNW